MGMAKEEAKKIIDRYLIKPHGMISCIINTFRKIDKGLKAVEDGKFLSHKEAKMRIFE